MGVLLSAPGSTHARASRSQCLPGRYGPNDGPGQSAGTSRRLRVALLPRLPRTATTNASQRPIWTPRKEATNAPDLLAVTRRTCRICPSETTSETRMRSAGRNSRPCTLKGWSVRTSSEGCAGVACAAGPTASVGTITAATSALRTRAMVARGRRRDASALAACACLLVDRDRREERVDGAVAAVCPHGEDIPLGRAAADVITEVRSDVELRGAPVGRRRAHLHGGSEGGPAVGGVHDEGVDERVRRAPAPHTAADADVAVTRPRRRLLTLVVDDIDHVAGEEGDDRPPTLDARSGRRRCQRRGC